MSLAGLVALRWLVPMPLALRIPVSATAIGLFALLLLVVVWLRRRWPIAAWLVARLARVPAVARRLDVSPAWVREMEAHVFRNLHDDRRRVGCRRTHRVQVGRGWARVYVYNHNPYKRVTAYRKSQRNAKSHDRGIWGLCR